MSYVNIHHSLRLNRGPASDYICICGKPAEHWAYQHTGEVLTCPQLDRLYSEDMNDYAPMCRSCHTLLDRKHNPEWDQAIRDHARKIGLTPKSFEHLSAAGKLGIVAASPKLVEHRQNISTLNRTAKRRCRECGATYSRVGLGRHQQAGGHTGWEDVI